MTRATVEAYRLTRRQRLVAAGLAAGKTVKEVADELGRSSKTVEYFWGQIKDRLHLTDKVMLAHWALAVGLVENRFLAGAERGNQAPI